MVDLRRRPGRLREVARGPVRVVYYVEGEEFGGVEQHLLTVLGHLDRERFEPTVLGVMPDRLAGELAAAGIEVTRFSRVRHKWDVAGWFAVVRAVRRARPTVFHAMLSQSYGAPYALVAAIGVPAVVVTAHLPTPASNRRQARIRRLLMRGVDAQVVPSEWTRSELDRLGQLTARSVVIANGIDRPSYRTREEARRELGLDPGAVVVGGAMRLVDWKRPDLVAGLTTLPGVDVVLLGDGPEAGVLAGADRTGRLHLAGFRADAADLLPALDVFVHPCPVDNQPLAVLEALGSGVPVVVADRGGTAGMVDDGRTGLQAEATPEAMAAAVAGLLADPTRSAALAGAASAELDDRFSAPAMVGRLEALYDTLLAGSPTPRTGRLPSHFVRNVFSNYATAVAALLVALVTTPILTSGLGSARFGVWALVGAMIPYLELLELGMANATVNRVAGRLEAGEPEPVNRAINTAFFVLIVPGLLAAAAAGVLALVLPHLVTIPPGLTDQARIVLLLLALDMAVSIPGDTFGGGLVALQRYDILNGTLTAVLLLQGAAWIVVMAAGGGLVMLGLVTVGISLVGQLARFLLLRRLLPGLHISIRAVEWGGLRPFAGLSTWFTLEEVTAAVAANADVLIVGIVVSVPAAGVYAVGQRLGLLASRFIAPASDVFFPFSAQVTARGEEDQLRESAWAGSRLAVGLAAPACLILAVLASPAIRAWAGPAFAGAGPVVVLLAVAAMISSVTVTGAVIIDGAGEPKKPSLIYSAELVVKIVLCVVLGHLYGLWGVALGTLVATALLRLGVLLPFVSRRLGLGLGRYVTWMVRAHVPPALVAGALGWFLVHRVGALARPSHSLAGAAVVAAAGLVVLIVYLAVFSLTGLDGRERGRVRARVGRGSAGGSGT